MLRWAGFATLKSGSFDFSRKEVRQIGNSLRKPPLVSNLQHVEYGMEIERLFETPRRIAVRTDDSRA